MYAVGDRVQHTKEFIAVLTHKCEDIPEKYTWLHSTGTVIDQLSQYRLIVKWDCDTEESIVAIDNVWFVGICGDSFYYDEREEMLVGFCKLPKGHELKCVPTVLR